MLHRCIDLYYFGYFGYKRRQHIRNSSKFVAAELYTTTTRRIIIVRFIYLFILLWQRQLNDLYTFIQLVCIFNGSCIFLRSLSLNWTMEGDHMTSLCIIPLKIIAPKGLRVCVFIEFGVFLNQSKSAVPSCCRQIFSFGVLWHDMLSRQLLVPGQFAFSRHQSRCKCHIIEIHWALLFPVFEQFARIWKQRREGALKSAEGVYCLTFKVIRWHWLNGWLIESPCHKASRLAISFVPSLTGCTLDPESQTPVTRWWRPIAGHPLVSTTIYYPQSLGFIIKKYSMQKRKHLVFVFETLSRNPSNE